jgi:hypothetical protein
MHTRSSCRVISKSRILAALCCVGLVSAVALAADQPQPPEAPPVSKFAPVEPLMQQIQYLIDDTPRGLNATRYTEASQTRVARNANALIVLLTAIGLSDQDSPLKASAPRLVELAEELKAAAADQAKAKAAYDALVQATKEGATGGKPLAWEKRFDLGLLMKQVSPTNSKLRIYTNTEARFGRAKKDELAGFAAFLATTGQAIHADTHEVKDPAMIGEWYKYAGEMRDAAGAVGEAITAGEFAAVKASVERLQTNCNGCHEVFRIDTTAAATEAEE